MARRAIRSAANTTFGNHANGVLIDASGSNQIQGNIIQANGNSGIFLEDDSSTSVEKRAAAGNAISGNQIGLMTQADAAQATSLRNKNDGITILAAGRYNDIKGNIISGSGNNGVLIFSTDSTIVENNFIGTDARGGDAVGGGAFGNGNIGVDINTSTQTFVQNNLISQNKAQGVVIASGSVPRTGCSMTRSGRTSRCRASTGTSSTGSSS